MKPSAFAIDPTLSVFVVVGAYQFYFWCQSHQLVRTREIKLSIDDWIPYRPRWVWIYSFLYYPMILYTNWIVESPSQFTRIAISYMLLLGLQIVFFIGFPVATPRSWRPTRERENYSERFLALVQSIDAQSNCFPSMHVSVAMLTALHLYLRFGLWTIAFPALIGLSCLFTKQHYVLDIPAGAALGWLAFYAYRLAG
jgi:membrane-associated phospholipid phosphatase